MFGGVLDGISAVQPYHAVHKAFLSSQFFCQVYKALRGCLSSSIQGKISIFLWTGTSYAVNILYTWQQDFEWISNSEP